MQDDSEPQLSLLNHQDDVVLERQPHAGLYRRQAASVRLLLSLCFLDLFASK